VSGVKWRAREMYYRAVAPESMGVPNDAPPFWWRGEMWDSSIYVRIRQTERRDGPNAAFQLAVDYTAEYLGVPRPVTL